MRLITFQSELLLKQILMNGIGRSELSVDNRVKSLHQRLCYKLDDKKYRPIYCFAMFGGYGVPSIDVIVHKWAWFMGYMQFSDLSDVFIELEVPEEEISMISLHCQRDGDILPLNDFHAIMSDYSCINDIDDDIEVLLSYIKKEWIVSYTVFDKHAGYHEQIIEPVILNPQLHPMYIRPVGLSGQGYYLDINNLTSDTSYYSDYSVKGTTCSDENLYITAVRNLLNKDSIHKLNLYLFGDSNISKPWDFLNTFTLGDIKKIREEKGRPLTREDLGHTNYTTLFD